MTWSLVAHAAQQGAGGSSVTTTGVDTTGADFIAIVIGFFAGNTPSVSDSKGNTWNARTTYSGGGTTSVKIYYAQAPTVGAGHTFTATVPGGFASVAVMAFSGSATTPFDVENGAGNAGGTSQQPGTITPAQTNELLVLGIAFGSGITATAPTANAGFSAAVDYKQGASGSAFGVADFWLADSVNTAINPGISWTGAADHAATIAAFKGAAGGTQFTKTLTASTTKGAALIRKVEKIVTGSRAMAGSLVSMKVKLVLLTASRTMHAVISNRAIHKTVTASRTMNAAVIRHISKKFTAARAMAGNLINGRAQTYLKTLTASINRQGSMSYLTTVWAKKAFAAATWTKEVFDSAIWTRIK